ncbi:hypothetical protein MMC13_003852 [Lambiella insularis]|nr:hypothetical protein [Lambiella insularis]
MTSASKATPRTAAGLTPSASSPPRSVPSPAHLQAPSAGKAGKSPHKHPSTGTPHNATNTPHHSSNTPYLSAGTPQAHAATPHATFGTPTPKFENLLGSSPMNGVDMKSAKSVTGSEVGMGTPALSTNGLALGMGLSLSSMGLGVGTPHLNATSMLEGLEVSELIQRDGEEETRRRVSTITSAVETRWGRVGREAVERSARRLGLECMWEHNADKSLLSIAGNGLLVDVEWQMDAVRGVVLNFPEAGEGEGRSAGVAAEVLKRDLVGNENGRYVGMGKFAQNLSRLARMDVLGRGGVSCFEAIEGLRVCLERLWLWEVGKMRGERLAEDEIVVYREVLCKKSGRPVMHGNGKIGLRMEYWRDRRLILPRKKNADKMTVDDTFHKVHDMNADDDSNIYSLIIDCEGSSAALYPSIRISDSWVSEAVEKASILDDESLLVGDLSSIDWQEPAPTFRPDPGSEAEAEAMMLDSHIASSSKLPDIRFVAHVDPPITVPLQKAMEIYNIVGSPLTQESIQMTTYTGLLFPEKSDFLPGTVLQNNTLHFDRTIRSWDENGAPATYRHQYTLLTNQQDWARTISEIPFSHPRQLVMILPMLRQWGFLGSTLRRTLGFDDTASVEKPTSATGKQEAKTGSTQKSDRLNGIKERKRTNKLQRPATPPSDTDSDDDSQPDPALKAPNCTRLLDLFLSLTTPATASLNLVIPLSAQRERTVTFHIGPNAEIHVEGNDEADVDGPTREATKDSMSIDDGDVEEGGTGKCRKRSEDLASVLSVAEDLSVLVEWVLR